MFRVGDEPVPGFRLEGVLGAGSGAEVWRASGPGRTDAALKFINLDGRLGLKEFRAIQRVKEIHHPHLLPITAFWILDDRECVLSDEVLEHLIDLAHGRETVAADKIDVDARQPVTLVVAMLLGQMNLLERLQEHRKLGNQGIPAEELLDYMEGAAKGIDYLNSPVHDLGDGPISIQHCDIKPQNILLVGNSAMVCDFGLARVGGSVGRTASGGAGTPAYMAPECIETTRASNASDQYCLAITYIELRTGRLPFDSEVLLEIYAAHTAGRLDLSHLPPGERDVIARATSLAPADRFPSAMEMVRSLRQVVGGEPDSTAMPAAGLPSTGLPSSGNDSRFYFDSGMAKIEQGEIEAAIAALSEAIRIDAQLAEAYDERAHAYYAMGDYRRAAADFSEVIRLRPELARSHHGRVRRNRGAAYRKLTLYDKAIAEYNEVIRVHPRCAAAFHDRAMALAAKGDYDAALSDFAKAVRLTKGRVTDDYLQDFASAYRQRGDRRHRDGQYDAAMADYNEAIRLRPGWGIVYNQRGLLFAAQEDFDRAIADYTTASKFDEQYAHLYRHNRGRALFHRGEYDRAIEDLNAAIALNPDYANAYRFRSRIHKQLGNEKKARADSARAEELER